MENLFLEAQPMAMSDMAIATTIVGQWHEIASTRAFCVLCCSNRPILSLYLNPAAPTPTNASISGSSGWIKGIHQMGLWLPWLGPPARAMVRGSMSRMSDVVSTIPM